MRSWAAKYILAGLSSLLVMQIVILAPQAVNVKNQDQDVGRINDLSRKGQKVRSEGSSENVLGNHQDRPVEIEQAIKGVHLVEASEGHQEWELWSQEALAFKSRNTWELQKVRVVLFAENGVKFTVVGERGEIETASKNLRVSGDVVTRSSNGYTFKTQTVDYDSQARVLHSPGEVEMTGPKEDAQGRLYLLGEGMRADFHTAFIDIDRSVRAERELPSHRHMTIRSDGAQFSGRQKLARFLGNVIIDMDDMRVTGPEAAFEYDPHKDTVRSIFVKGGVRVSDTEKWASSQNLKVDFEDNKFVFRGDPRVVQDNDELRGEEITFLDGGRRIIVQKARATVDEKKMEREH